LRQRENTTKDEPCVMGAGKRNTDRAKQSVPDLPIAFLSERGNQHANPTCTS
jgi:hypothetical protein